MSGTCGPDQGGGRRAGFLQLFLCLPEEVARGFDPDAESAVVPTRKHGSSAARPEESGRAELAGVGICACFVRRLFHVPADTLEAVQRLFEQPANHPSVAIAERQNMVERREAILLAITLHCLELIGVHFGRFDCTPSMVG